MFCFRLALALGYTVGELLDVVTSEELSLWEEYARRHPFGDERADVRSAYQTACVVSATVGKTMKVKDFLPQWQEEKKQSWQEVQAYFKRLAESKNG